MISSCLIFSLPIYGFIPLSLLLSNTVHGFNANDFKLTDSESE